MRRIPKIRSGVASGIHPSIVSCNRKPKVNRMMTEFSFPQLIVVPLSCHEVDGVRKEKERLTAAQRGNDQKRAVKIRNDHKNPRYFPWNRISNFGFLYFLFIFYFLKMLLLFLFFVRFENYFCFSALYG